MHQYDFYCYSLGCLSLAMALTNQTLGQAYAASHRVQQAWLQGNLTRYQLVENFLLDDVFRLNEHVIQEMLPRLNILITTVNEGLQVRQATCMVEFYDLLLQTTWIPFVTGEGATLARGDNYILDGGFSRMLHPTCQQELYVPLTWKLSQFSLDPSFDLATATEFWSMGQAAPSLETPAATVA